MEIRSWIYYKGDVKIIATREGEKIGSYSEAFISVENDSSFKFDEDNKIATFAEIALRIKNDITPETLGNVPTLDFLNDLFQDDKLNSAQYEALVGYMTNPEKLVEINNSSTSSGGHLGITPNASPALYSSPEFFSSNTMWRVSFFEPSPLRTKFCETVVMNGFFALQSAMSVTNPLEMPFA